jgi:hypothetical protein
MNKNPVFNLGENVIITDAIDDHYNGKTGVVVEDDFRPYIGDYVYVIKMDDGYEAEFTADEISSDDQW